MRSLTWKGWALIGAFLFLAFVAGAAFGASPAPAAPAPYFTGGNFGGAALFVDCKPVRVQPDGKHARCPLIVNGHQNYGVQHTYSLHLSDGTVLTVPAGMTTDFASVPKVFWPWLPPDGPYGKAAGIHDDCFKTKGSFVWHWPGHAKEAPFVGLAPGHAPLTFDGCNEALRQGMVALQVPAWQRVIVYEAVETFGHEGWGN